MKNFKIQTLLLTLMLFVLIVFAGCGEQSENGNTSSNQSVDGTTETASAERVEGATSMVSNHYDADAELGKGSKTITVKVVDNENKTVTFTVHSDAITVGAALLEVGLVKGDAQQAGLYITHVNGIEASWDNDKSYWSFYQNGEMMMKGIDQTDLIDGDIFEIKYAKG